ncbi:MAG: hypothetical protein H6799_00845 [Candidatus Nomurabacteria bacterium]|nr:MAG: hypothetical protein H6799_00845 [Candidatus Nomurabacteria bacterium]HRV75874.1 hypothetical protein [Candidatus Saccharimonadales bacterium]
MSSFDLSAFVKKPIVMIGGVIIILILLFMIFFGGGGGEDPTAKSVKNLSNQHQALVNLIDGYSRSVKSANLKSNISQVSIILIANKNDLDTYFSGLSKESRKVKSTVSTKPKKDLITRLDQAKISNNLDSEIKSVVLSELQLIENAIQKIKKENSNKASLSVLTDKLILNNQTIITRLNESR